MCNLFSSIKYKDIIYKLFNCKLIAREKNELSRQVSRKTRNIVSVLTLNLYNFIRNRQIYIIFFFVKIHLLSIIKLVHIYIECNNEIYILRNCKNDIASNLLQIRIILTTFCLIEIFFDNRRNSTKNFFNFLLFQSSRNYSGRLYLAKECVQFYRDLQIYCNNCKILSHVFVIAIISTIYIKY